MTTVPIWAAMETQWPPTLEVFYRHIFKQRNHIVQV